MKEELQQPEIAGEQYSGNQCCVTTVLKSRKLGLEWLQREDHKQEANRTEKGGKAQTLEGPGHLGGNEGKTEFTETCVTQSLPFTHSVQSYTVDSYLDLTTSHSFIYLFLQ